MPCNADSECSTWITNPCDRAYCNMNSAICEFSPITGCNNGAILETWSGIGGTAIDSLLSDYRFPDAPSNVQFLTNRLEAPTNMGDNFGGRLRTYIMPPETCNYTFYIASDNSSRLNLSNDTETVNKKLIAWTDLWTSPREWNKYASQKSTPVHLIKGKNILP